MRASRLFSPVLRPVTVSDAAPAAPAPQPQQRPFDADATRVFAKMGARMFP
jgi:hypothetical protein